MFCFWDNQTPHKINKFTTFQPRTVATFLYIYSALQGAGDGGHGPEAAGPRPLRPRHCQPAQAVPEVSRYRVYLFKPFILMYLYLASLYLCSVCTQGATSVSPAHLLSCPSGRVSCLRPKGTDSPLMVMILARNGPDPPDNPAFLYMAGYRICRAANPAENLQLVFRGQKFATTGKSLCPVLYFEESNMI